MAKKQDDITTAAQLESFRIRLNSLSPRLRTRFSTLTKVERVFYGAICATAVILAFSIVFIQMKTYQIQSSTNTMRLDMVQTQNQIQSYNQDLQAMQASGKVGTAASQSGMTQNQSNVTKATK